MKRFILVLILCLTLAAVFSISTFAEEQNIAPSATVTTNAIHWQVVGNDSWAPNAITNMVDGDYTKGVPSCANSRLMFIYFDFETNVCISKMVLHCNGSGIAGNIGEMSNVNANVNIGIYVEDADGKNVFEKWLNPYNLTELCYEPEVPVTGRKVTIRFDSDYNTRQIVLLRELEIFAHDHAFDTLKETIQAPTCIKDGVGIYECGCGKTEEGPILAIGEHAYEEIVGITYENGYLENGTKAFGCKYDGCNDTKEESAGPLFKFLGYSKNASGTKLCVGYVINYQQISEYEEINKATIEYGSVIAVSQTKPYESKGSIVRSLKEQTSPRFDIVLSTSNWSGIENIPLVMCMYVADGIKIQYICSDTITEEANTFTYLEM